MDLIRVNVDRKAKEIEVNGTSYKKDLLQATESTGRIITIKPTLSPSDRDNQEETRKKMEGAICVKETTFPFITEQ